jgi:hypothetical protein
VFLTQHGPVIEHRIDKRLSPNRVAPVVTSLSNGGREATTGARAADSDPIGVNTQLAGVRAHP